jgi:hypothetical protein
MGVTRWAQMRAHKSLFHAHNQKLNAPLNPLLAYHTSTPHQSSAASIVSLPILPLCMQEGLPVIRLTCNREHKRRSGSILHPPTTLNVLVRAIARGTIQ